jgi:hypothetical protein
MIILITATGVFIVWIIGGFLVHQHKQYRFREKLDSLEGRIVKLSDELTEKAPYKGHIYGRINDVPDYSWKEFKIYSFNVELLPTEKLLIEAEKEAREDFKQEIANYKKSMNHYHKSMKELSDRNNQVMHRLQQSAAQMYNGQYQSYVPQEPRKPEFHFEYDEYVTMRISKKDVKLMPKNFDYISGTIIKSLDSKKKKGGERKVRRMPRLFRFALYLALIVLVWDVVLNANSIANFVVQTFILHK